MQDFYPLKLFKRFAVYPQFSQLKKLEHSNKASKKLFSNSVQTDEKFAEQDKDFGFSDKQKSLPRKIPLLVYLTDYLF